MTSGPRPTEKQIERAKKMLADGATWSDIARLTDCTIHLIRREIEPNYKKHREDAARAYRAKMGYGRLRNHVAVSNDGSKVGMSAGGIQSAEVRAIPPAALSYRERMSEHIPTINEAVLGDPPIWRSALGKRR